MPADRTEAIHAKAAGLESLPDAEVLRRLLAGHAEALNAVAWAAEAIAAAAGLMAGALRADGRLIYAGAGSSALMAISDGMELAGTFGIAPDRVRLCMAGGLPTDARMPGDTEDDAAQAARDARGIVADDVVIAVSASGRTPYTLRFAECARAAGASTICIAGNPGAPLFDHATVPVLLPTPPELVAGSTRLGAGTAQKVALNLMSTLMGLRLGHVHDGMMVNLRPDNAKLRVRARDTIARITGASAHQAEAALDAGGGSVKIAVLLIAGAPSPEAAKTVLDQSGGHLRMALSALARPE